MRKIIQRKQKKILSLALILAEIKEKRVKAG